MPRAAALQAPAFDALGSLPPPSFPTQPPSYPSSGGVSSCPLSYPGSHAATGPSPPFAPTTAFGGGQAVQPAVGMFGQQGGGGAGALSSSLNRGADNVAVG